MLIATPRILIEPFTSADRDAVKLLLQDPDVVRHTGFRTVVPDWDIPAKLANWVDQGQESLGIWKASERTSTGSRGAPIGMVMLKETELPYPELGYMLAQSQWGKGYATELARAVLSYGFNTVRLSHIVACTDGDNAASIKILTKIGMIPYDLPPLDAEPRTNPAGQPGVYFIKKNPTLTDRRSPPILNSMD